jgi:uncharacterized membrane protein YecN with MAPEG domain
MHPAIVVVLGGLFFLGRLLHAQALTQANLKLRVRGMVLTFGTLTTLAILNIILAVRAWV